MAAAATLVTLSLGLAAWTYQACAVYDPSLLLPAVEDAGNPDASPDADKCSHTSPPPRPNVPDTDAGIEIVAAFKTIDIGLTADASAPRPAYGYDLDGVCTCPGPPSCAGRPGAPPACDDDAAGLTGQDNTDIDLFRDLGVAAATGTGQIDDGLQAGQYGLLLVIDGYNGQPNDPSVTVSYYVSNGVNRSGDGGIQTPTFGGTDLWTIDPSSLAVVPSDPSSIPSCADKPAQCRSAYEDDTAYVTNNVVVAHFASSLLPVAFGDRSFLGGATMQLSSAYIVGKLQTVNLVPDGFSYELVGGTLAGRWPTGRLLSTLATIPDPSVDGGFLCGNTFSYDLIKFAACGAADISQDTRNDNAVPLVACDAVSVGMLFTAGPAQLGAVYSVPPPPAGCRDGGLPFTDRCN